MEQKENQILQKGNQTPQKENQTAQPVKIAVTDATGAEVTLFVLEETKINGMYYLLAADTEDGDGDCYILKDVSRPEDTEAVYEPVENDSEAEYVFRIFQELMGDSGVDLQN